MSVARRLVLIHGFTERPSMWDSLIAGLENSSIAISTPSIPGHGNCPEIPVEHTAISYCEAILQQIPDDDLQWIIVGHSMGGYLASNLVRLVAPRIYALGFFHSKAGADTAEKIEDRKRAITAASQNKDFYLATMLQNTLAEENRKPLNEELTTMIEQAKNDITSACIQAAQEVMIERPDNIAFLAQAQFPIYYFLGKQDKSIPLELMNAELNALPQANIHIAETAGHMGHIECKQQALAWLKKMCA